MDAILRKIEARQAARATLAMPEAEPSAAELAAAEAMRAAHEQHVREMEAYRQRVEGHMRKLMAGPHKWTQYPPLDHERMLVIARTAESFGLVSHEFGEDGIDRFIIVYKPEHQPDDLEITRLNLKHTQKMDDASIARILANATAAAAGASEAEERRPKKPKKKAEEMEDEEMLKKEKLVAVGTVKRVRRSAAEAMEEIRMKKKIAGPSTSSGSNVAGGGGGGDEDDNGEDPEKLFE